MLTAIGLAAICALASANTAQVIADLEAKLADAQARAGVTINRSARDATMERNVRQAAKIGSISVAVNDLTERMAALKSTQQSEISSLPTSIAAVATAANAVSSSIARIDDTLAAFKLLKAKADSIPAAVDAQVTSLNMQMTTLSQNMDSMRSSVDSANKATLAQVDAKIAASQAEAAAATSALESSSGVKVKAMEDSLANAGKSRSIYVNWGSVKCEGGAATLYSGWTYATYHDHNGGVTPQCLKNAGGEMGGRHGGWDSLDWMYPSRTDNCGGTKLDNQGRCGKQIPCSMCQIEKSCYVETGTDKCSAEGYKTVYKGWLYGSHNGHRSTHRRICMSEDGNGWGRNDGHGSYFYPSLNNNGMQSVKSDKTLKCHQCCK
jgi:hypothetical protein